MWFACSASLARHGLQEAMKYRRHISVDIFLWRELEIGHVVQHYGKCAARRFTKHNQHQIRLLRRYAMGHKAYAASGVAAFVTVHVDGSSGLEHPHNVANVERHVCVRRARPRWDAASCRLEFFRITNLH